MAPFGAFLLTRSCHTDTGASRYDGAGRGQRDAPFRTVNKLRQSGINRANPESGSDGDRVISDDDQARFASVVLPHLADAYALARWIMGDRTDAEDVVQDACLRAFRSIGTFGGHNARAWTLTIVRNAAYTWLSKRRTTPVVAVGDLEDI